MKIIIYGSTGSIGLSTLEVIRKQKKENGAIKILALTGNNNVEQLCEDAIEFGVDRVVMANDKAFVGSVRCV